MSHGVIIPTFRRGPASALASAWHALCCLWATPAWIWLARSGAFEAAPILGLVLLDGLPELLDALGAQVCRHG